MYKIDNGISGNLQVSFCGSMCECALQIWCVCVYVLYSSFYILFAISTGMFMTYTLAYGF